MNKGLTYENSLEDANLDYSKLIFPLNSSSLDKKQLFFINCDVQSTLKCEKIKSNQCIKSTQDQFKLIITSELINSNFCINLNVRLIIKLLIFK